MEIYYLVSFLLLCNCIIIKCEIIIKASSNYLVDIHGSQIMGNKDVSMGAIFYDPRTKITHTLSTWRNNGYIFLHNGNKNSYDTSFCNNYDVNQLIEFSCRENNKPLILSGYIGNIRRGASSCDFHGLCTGWKFHGRDLKNSQGSGRIELVPSTMFKQNTYKIYSAGKQAKVQSNGGIVNDYETHREVFPDVTFFFMKGLYQDACNHVKDYNCSLPYGFD